MNVVPCVRTYTLLKVTNYNPNINKFTSSVQQKNTHQATH